MTLSKDKKFEIAVFLFCVAILVIIDILAYGGYLKKPQGGILHFVLTIVISNIILFLILYVLILNTYNKYKHNFSTYGMTTSQSVKFDVKKWFFQISYWVFLWIILYKTFLYYQLLTVGEDPAIWAYVFAFGCFFPLQCVINFVVKVRSKSIVLKRKELWILHLIFSIILGFVAVYFFGMENKMMVDFLIVWMPLMTFSLPTLRYVKNVIIIA